MKSTEFLHILEGILLTMKTEHNQLSKEDTLDKGKCPASCPGHFVPREMAPNRIEGWVGPKASGGNPFCPCQELKPGLPANSLVTIHRLSHILP